MMEITFLVLYKAMYCEYFIMLAFHLFSLYKLDWRRQLMLLMPRNQPEKLTVTAKLDLLKKTNDPGIFPKAPSHFIATAKQKPEEGHLKRWRLSPEALRPLQRLGQVSKSRFGWETEKSQVGNVSGACFPGQQDFHYKSPFWNWLFIKNKIKMNNETKFSISCLFVTCC